jgi:hypothetical protein
MCSRKCEAEDALAKVRASAPARTVEEAVRAVMLTPNLTAALDDSIVFSLRWRHIFGDYLLHYVLLDGNCTGALLHQFSSQNREPSVVEVSQGQRLSRGFIPTERSKSPPFCNMQILHKYPRKACTTSLALSTSRHSPMRRWSWPSLE